ncbi:MAG: aspartyl protease family protein [Sphingomonadales bacterium]|nr:aspartyl protease family protein [Sphingomonadales bacterium]
MFLLAAAICAADISPAHLLDMHRAAIGTNRAGTLTMRYAYSGQGLTGATTVTADQRTGMFVTDTVAGPSHSAAGYDGKTPWMADVSGFHSAQTGGDKPALAVNEAYRRAELWTRPDRGGAAIEALGCGKLQVTPKGGKPFVATFDPRTGLLSEVRERQSYGVASTIRYADYRRRAGMMVATRVEMLTNDDPSSAETLRLTSLTMSAPRTAARYAMPASNPADFSLPPSGRATLPFRLINNHIVVDARIDGKGPFPFLVDTGGHDILTLATVRTLGLRPIGATPSFGAGEQANTSGYVRVARIDAGGGMLTDQTIITLDFSPPAVEGLTFGGMIGVEFFQRFVVRIDYGAKTITFIDPRRFDVRERASAGTGMSFDFYEHMPQVAGTIDGRPARFDIDTGSRSDVTFTRPFVEKAGLRAAYPDGVTITDGWGVGGPARSYVVRSRSLSLGGVTVERPIAALSAAKAGSFADEGSDGNIGSGLLKRFVVTFDYPHRRLYLQRLARPDADTGRFDRTGMWINQQKSGFEIMDLADNGPATTAGLKKGDVVLAIGGQDVASLSLSDARSMLKTVAVGQPLPISYRRDGKISEAIVTPRDLIPD